MAKKPREQKSKEEILADMKKNADFQKKLAFTRERFYPALLATDCSIEDAEMWLSGFNTALMQEFLGKMKEVQMKDLDLASKLSGDQDFVAWKHVIHLFDDFDVFTAKDHIEGLRGEIGLWKKEEERGRKLSDLKVKWIDEI